jgi:hypothetical protein
MVDHSAIRRYLHVLLIFIAIHTLACRARTKSSSMEQRFDALSRVDSLTRDLPYRAKAAVIGTAYDELFASVRAGETPGRVSSHDMDLLYRAAQLTAFYTIDESHIRDMVSFLATLEDQGAASKSHYMHMHEAFIKARMLTEAREFARRHPLPELEVLPELREAADLVAGRPTEWAVAPNKHELLRRSVDLHQPAQVVIVSHPSCHFSQAATQDIQSDPVLGKIFSAHARWLAPQDARVDFDVLQRSNREHPEQETTLAFRREEWPMIDSWNTPTFYFFKNGALSAKVEGWPKGGRRSELLAALQQIGLLQ